MKQKKYSSQKTRSQHTYQFFKDRRNDPAWHADFLRVRTIRRRNFILKSGLSLLILLIGFTIFKNYRQPSTDKAIQTNNLKESSNSAETSTSKITDSSKTSSQASTQQPIIIKNYTRYSNYSGNYQASADSCLLDFEKGTLTSTGATKQQIFYFDKVILHPDNSLVINIHGNYHYNADDGQVERQKLMHLSILLAPANKKIQQNWQTGTKIEDTTDTSKNRLTFANSDDNGKTFNMEPAYTVFSDNSTTPPAGQSSYTTLYTFTN